MRGADLSPVCPLTAALSAGGGGASGHVRSGPESSLRRVLQEDAKLPRSALFQLGDP